jgi:hypothetical protein
VLQFAIASGTGHVVDFGVSRLPPRPVPRENRGSRVFFISEFEILGLPLKLSSFAKIFLQTPIKEV